LFVFFYQFVNGLSERYSEIYEDRGSSTQFEVNFGKKWKGYATITELANGDITKFDEITREPLEKCLLYLSYKTDKIELENLLHKEAMKKIN
jgi:hypothetical protein